MKKILIGIFLSLSFSLACDKPHEEIGGFKLGCSAKEQNLKDVTKGRTPPTILFDSLYRSDDVVFFDFVEADVNDGVIETLGFEKSYTLTLRNLRVEKSRIIKDINFVIEALEKRWGSADKKEIDKFLRLADIDSTWMNKIEDGAIIKVENSPVVSNVIILISSNPTNDQLLKSWEVTLIVGYFSKNAKLLFNKNITENSLNGF